MAGAGLQIRTTLPIFPEHPHEDSEAPATQVANCRACRNIEISRKYRKRPIPQNPIARAGVHLLGPSQPKGTKNHTPGICKIQLTLIDSDQLAEAPCSMHASGRLQPACSRPHPSSLLSSASVLWAAPISLALRFPRRDNKCVRKRGVIY